MVRSGVTRSAFFVRITLPTLPNLVTVNPKESSQFGSIPPNDGNATKPIWFLRDQPFLWDEDRLGLRVLNKKGGLRFEESCKGQHMDLGYGTGGDGCADRIVRKWIGWKQ